MANEATNNESGTNNQLKSTVQINGESYDINAKHADTASSADTATTATTAETARSATTAETANKVANSITIHKTGYSGKRLENPIVFNGNAPQELDIIPSTGGKFAGPIRVHNADPSDTAIKKNVKENGEYFEDAVLNYHDIYNIFQNQVINTAIMYKWELEEGTTDDYKLTLVYDNGTAVNNSTIGLSIIEGKSADATAFAQFNNNIYSEWSGDTKQIDWIPAYLYLGSKEADDTTNYTIYFGKASSAELYPIVINDAENAETAKSAEKLDTNSWIITNLTKKDTKTIYTGETNTEIGVTGTLSVSNGGTGCVNETDACAKLTDGQNLKVNSIIVNAKKFLTNEVRNEDNETTVHANYLGSIALNNGSITGINGLFFADRSGDAMEGLNFAKSQDGVDKKENYDLYQENGRYQYNSTTKFDRLFVLDGQIYLKPDCMIGEEGNTTYTIYHTGNLTSLPVKMYKETSKVGFEEWPGNIVLSTNSPGTPINGMPEYDTTGAYPSGTIWIQLEQKST